MKSDPNVIRAFLKYVIALRTDPSWGHEALLVRAAASQDVEPEVLRSYVTARMGLPEGASADELALVSRTQDQKGR